MDAILSAFAEPASATETQSHYQLTAASIWRARRQGLSLADILQTLETHSLPLAAWVAAGIALLLTCLILGKTIGRIGLWMSLGLLLFLVSSLLVDFLQKEGLFLNTCFFLLPVVLPVALLYGWALALVGFPAVSERFCHRQAVVHVPRRKIRIVQGAGHGEDVGHHER